jgi:hypothetical protein
MVFKVPRRWAGSVSEVAKGRDKYKALETMELR